MNPHRRGALVAALALIALLATMSGPAFASGRDRGSRSAHDHERASKPLVIGHRGAAGYRPEHTLASYALAARMGADYIEPDLVSTKDGVMVARHEPDIGGTTNVADHPEFASRRTTKVIDGTTFSNTWFVEDFTLAELKTLRAKERLPQDRQRNTIYNNRYQVPTFDEILRLRERLSKQLGRDIGVYPETKHPTYFRSIGLPLEGKLLQTLRNHGLDKRGSKVFIQSFEVNNLKALNRQTDLPLVQLFDAKTKKPADGSSQTYGEMATPAGLHDVAKYADGAGPSKDYIVPRDPNGCSLPPTSFVRDAHAAGLQVHPYTFRNENEFLPCELRSSANPFEYGNAIAEDQQFFALGVDGIFTDNTDTAIEARDGVEQP
jgi:glycerophosphoryl diester phosphodiesterase